MIVRGEEQSRRYRRRFEGPEEKESVLSHCQGCGVDKRELPEIRMWTARDRAARLANLFETKQCARVKCDTPVRALLKGVCAS